MGTSSYQSSDATDTPSQIQRLIIAKAIFSRGSGAARNLAFPPEAPDNAPMNALRSHLTLRAGALGAALLLFIACGADAGDSAVAADAGAGGASPQPGGTGGAGGEATGGTPTPAGCDPVDSVCPVARPLAGTPCVSGLSCVYPATRADPAIFTLTCPDGQWVEAIDCEAAGVGGACGLPVFTEFCESATLSGFGALTVEVGPDAPGEDFRPFTDGETVTQVVGGQGSPMLPFRVRLSGGDPEAAPTCVELGTQLREAGTPEAPPSLQNLRIRCGTSMRAFIVDPLALCDDRLFDVALSVSLTGGPSTTVHLTIQGSPPDGNPFSPCAN
jgi:hypothetical protein